MGCVGSKVKYGVAVSHCRQRKRFVKRAINSRKHFVNDHGNYLLALKTVGAAFREFALVEFREQQSKDLSSTPNPSHTSAAEMDRSSLLAVTKVPAPANHSPMSCQNAPFPSKSVIVAPPTSEVGYYQRDTMETALATCGVPNSVGAIEGGSFRKMPPLVSMAYINTPSVSERVVISPMKVVAYQHAAIVSDAVTLSPPQTPEDQRGWNGHYLYNNISPQVVVENGMPASTPQEPDASSSLIFTAGWEWLDLFSAAPTAMHFEGSPSVIRDEASRQAMHFEGSPSVIRDEASRQVVDEEMPALEVEGTPPREIKADLKNGEIEEVKAVETNEVKVEKESQAAMDIPKVAENESHEQEEEEDLRGGDDEGGGTSLKPLLNSEAEGVTTKKDLIEAVKKNFQKSKNLVEVLAEIDVQFLKASESGKNVFKVLKASNSHYHSNYTDLQGFSDHSSRSLSSISRSYRTPFSSTSTLTSTSFLASTPTSSSTPTSIAASEDSTAEDPSFLEGHASTLDKIYAWENKLCKEVKERELINIKLERKRRKVQALDARREEDDKVDKVRAALKVLETERIVADHAMDVTISTIRNLTNAQLHPQLLQLLEELTTVWREMCACHEHQRDAVFSMHIPEDPALESTSNSHRRVTQQLESALNDLLKSFSAVMTSQKAYIQSLNGWLSSSLYGLERGSNQTSASIPTKDAPHIYYLCRRWKQALDKLPYNMVMAAIKKFVKIAREMINLQSSELRIKKHLDKSTKALARKIKALHNAQLKQSGLMKARKENSASDEQVLVKGRVEERSEQVERQRKKVEREREIYFKAMQTTRRGTLSNVKTCLPELFQSFAEFATQCSEAYATLYIREKNGKFESD